MAKVFFSYSHKDEDLRNRLETHLSMLKRQGQIEPWHDRRITAGDDLDNSIMAELEAADIVLFLVSADFLASNYCYEAEVARALERHKIGNTRVIPVILRPCEWRSAPFGNLLALPTDGKPVTKWADLDDAFLDIATGIREAVEKTRPRPVVSTSRPPIPGAEPEMIVSPRSSNLGIVKRFTEQERDEFRNEAFEFLAKFFANSVAELQERYPDLKTAFRRIDANRFTAAVYRNGTKEAACTIFLGGAIGRGIAFAFRDDGETGSMNESLDVEHDDHSLFLRPLGMLRIGSSSGRETKFTMQGAAEYFWTAFIEPLQR